MNKKQFDFYARIRAILETARHNAYRAVNFAMVQAYWQVGREIVEEEQRGKRRAGYGEYIIVMLAEKLTKDFSKGFDERNLRSMRSFYVTFPIRNALRSELTWTHYRLLLRIENSDARGFYVKESIEGNWSTRQLERQINSFYYERLIASKNKLPVKKEAADNAKKMAIVPKDIIKDPYVLEFLDLSNSVKHTESDLESAIIGKLQQFLLELGKGFCFIARQKRISAQDDHFYVDLVFYNHILKCFLLIDLKTGKLTHQDIGQMDFYVRYFEDRIKGKDDNPTIGLILCAEKNETVAKYSVLADKKGLFASKYRLYLPSEKELSREIEREKKILALENKLKSLPAGRRAVKP